MKKIYLLSAILATTLSFGQQNLPLYEGFNYTVGNALNGQATWTGVAATPDDALISAGTLSFPGLPASTGNSVTFSENGLDPQLSFVTQNTVGNTVYASFILKITNIPTTLTDAAGTHFAGLGASTTTFSSTLWFKKAADGVHFNLGINRATTIGDTQWIATDFNQNEDILIVLGYTIDATNSTSKLWVNPTLGGAEPATTATATVGTNRTSLDRVYFRQDNATKTPTIIVDELRIATSWTEVTTTTAPLGVSENNIAGLKMYPNPVVNGKLFISSDLNTERSIAIYDVTGKQVVNTVTASELINVSSLNAGVYFVKITEEGKTATRKLVIK